MGAGSDPRLAMMEIFAYSLIYYASDTMENGAISGGSRGESNILFISIIQVISY